VAVGLAYFYRQGAAAVETERYAHGVEECWIDRSWLGRGPWGLVLLAVLFVPFFGYWTLLGAGAHAVAYLGILGSINALGHNASARDGDRSRNLRWFSWFSFGEAYHGTHHQYENSPRLSSSRLQSDPGWLVIRILRVLGVVEVTAAGEHSMAQMKLNAKRS
jgi:stearoyl-CoA desaturase (delta-9 desaturase)